MNQIMIYFTKWEQYKQNLGWF